MNDSKSTAETWTEIRCPACVSLGYSQSRLLLKITGKVEKSDAVLQMKCNRCKSLINWQIGTPVIYTFEHGLKTHRRQTVAFE